MGVAVLHDHIRVGMRPPEQFVADVAADHPRPNAGAGGGLFEQLEELLVGYWLIRAHSTAPTCPARSPSRARRRRGPRVGLIKRAGGKGLRHVGCAEGPAGGTPA